MYGVRMFIRLQHPRAIPWTLSVVVEASFIDIVKAVDLRQILRFHGKSPCGTAVKKNAFGPSPGPCRLSSRRALLTLSKPLICDKSASSSSQGSVASHHVGLRSRKMPSGHPLVEASFIDIVKAVELRQISV